jgi:hypothetical protein
MGGCGPSPPLGSLRRRSRLGRNGSFRSATPMPGCPTTRCPSWATPCESRSLPQTTSTAVTPRSSASTPCGAGLSGRRHPPRPDGGHPPSPSTGALLSGRPHLPQRDGGHPLNLSTPGFPKLLVALRPSARTVDPAAGEEPPQGGPMAWSTGVICSFTSSLLYCIAGRCGYRPELGDEFAGLAPGGLCSSETSMLVVAPRSSKRTEPTLSRSARRCCARRCAGWRCPRR